MAQTFGSLTKAEVQLALATRSLTQLHKRVVIAKMGVTDYAQDPGYEQGDVVSITRAKKKKVVNYDIRSQTGAPIVEHGHISRRVPLEMFFPDGYPIYSTDNQNSQRRYIVDYSNSAAGGIGEAVDEYMYDRCFRDYSDIPDTGTGVMIDACAPIKIVSTPYSAGSFGDYTDLEHRNARASLDRDDVPEMGLFSSLSVNAFNGIRGSTTLVENTSASTVGGGIILRDAPNEVMARGLMTRQTNQIKSQTTTGGGALGTFETNVWDTTTFLQGDYTVAEPLPVLKMTAGTPGGDFATDAAKGVIVQFTVGSDNLFGVILRVETGDTIYVKPYYENGQELINGTAVASTAVTAPVIPSVNVACHNEFLVFANRRHQLSNAMPEQVSTIMIPSLSPLLLNMWLGTVNVPTFQAPNAITWLGGARPTDWRKAVLCLSK